MLPVTLYATNIAPATRIDHWLHQQLPQYSRTQLQRWIREQHVQVNARVVKSKYIMQEGDEITVAPPETADPSSIQAEDIPLQIIHEDEDIIVINKAPGMVVHPGAGCYSGTVVNALLHHCNDLSGIGGVERPGIVHRLDRGTSGIMIAAKHDQAHQHLSAQFAQRQVRKEYLAIVYGMPAAEGTIDEPIGRHPTDRKKMSIHSKVGKPAVSHWILEEVFAQLASTLRVRIETGRTHQIRVHLTARGYALLGDAMYGGNKFTHRLPKTWHDALEQLRRPALHAHRLTVTHPRTEAEHTWTADLPEDLTQLCQNLRTLSKAS